MTIRRDHLREARQARGLTALDVAEATGLREATVYATERGRRCPTRPEAEAWARAVKVQPETLFPEVYRAEGGDA